MKDKMSEKMVVSRRSADKSSTLSKEDEDILLDLDSNKKESGRKANKRVHDVNEDVDNASTSKSTKFGGT